MPSSLPTPVRFRFTQGRSEIYGTVHRPGAKVYILTERGTWLPHSMLVDTGADYTLLPRSIGEFLGFRRKADERLYRAGGVGGGTIRVVMRRVMMRLGRHEFSADVGWSDSDEVPLLLGRSDVFDLFDVHFLQRERVTEFRWRGA